MQGLNTTYEWVVLVLLVIVTVLLLLGRFGR
jgi:hypothetical protein